MAEAARDEQQRHDHEQRLDGQAEPADEAEAPDGRDGADEHGHEDAGDVAHVEGEHAEHQDQGDREDLEGVVAEGVDPPGHDGEAGGVDLVRTVGLVLDDGLDGVEDLVVIDGLLDEGGVDDGGGAVGGHEEGVGSGGFVDAAADLGELLCRLGQLVVHDGLREDAVGGDDGVARLGGGDREDLVVVDPGRQVDVARDAPDLLERVGLEHVLAVGPLDHQRDRQRVAEVGVVLVDLHEGVVLREQVREDGLHVHAHQAHRKERRDQPHHHQDRPPVPQCKSRQLASQVSFFHQAPRSLDFSCLCRTATNRERACGPPPPAYRSSN